MSELPAGGGPGLRILEQRARAIGAPLEIVFPGGAGTDVRCTLPPRAWPGATFVF